jgi:phosphate transport system permease protein
VKERSQIRSEERVTAAAAGRPPGDSQQAQRIPEPERTHPPPAPVLTPAELRKRFRLSEFLSEKIITSVAFVSLASILMIFLFVFRESAPLFFADEPAAKPAGPAEVYEEETYGEEFLSDEVRKLESLRNTDEEHAVDAVEGDASLSNLFSTEWQPISREPKYGFLPLLIGSAKVTFLAIIIGGPLAILAALFTSAFAPRWAKEVLKPAIEILAGFPSVVIGFFALMFLASALQGLFGYPYRLNAFVGGVAMSLAVIPIVYTVSEDALSAVPKYMKEASLALGAGEWQTALFVTLPAATPGVFAALLLGVGRAFGETMIVLMATGNAALLSLTLTDPVRTMSATIGAEMAEVVFGDTHYHVLFFLGSILFLFTFVLNGVAEWVVRQRLMRRFKGE